MTPVAARRTGVVVLAGFVSIAAFLFPHLVGLEVDWLWAAALPAFLMSSALILSQQPRNSIGWLLLVPASAWMADLAVATTGFLDQPPTVVTVPVVAALTLQNLTWMMLMFPIFHLLFVFPTGQVVGRPWAWLVRLELVMVVVLAVAGFFSEQVGPFDTPVEWSVGNPFGFVPASFFSSLGFNVVWTAGLLALTVGGVASIGVRFRRAGAVERQQLKWLALAVSCFAVVYFVSAVSEGQVFEAIFVLSIVGIPVSIAVAVLRYRLFDIDYIIRRTVSYALVVGAIGMVFAASIATLTVFLPSDDPIVVAASTLAAAALFNPLRRRLQGVVDRRFNRSYFDTAMMVEAFVSALPGESDPTRVGEGMIGVAERAMQPRTAGLWIRQ